MEVPVISLIMEQMAAMLDNAVKAHLVGVVVEDMERVAEAVEVHRLLLVLLITIEEVLGEMVEA